MHEYICPNCPIDITFKMGYAQLHSYIQIDITLVFINVSIVYIPHYAPLYSTYKAF